MVCVCARSFHFVLSWCLRTSFFLNMLLLLSCFIDFARAQNLFGPVFDSLRLGRWVHMWFCFSLCVCVCSIWCVLFTISSACPRVIYTQAHFKILSDGPIFWWVLLIVLCLFLLWFLLRYLEQLDEDVVVQIMTREFACCCSCCFFLIWFREFCFPISWSKVVLFVCKS